MAQRTSVAIADELKAEQEVDDLRVHFLELRQEAQEERQERVRATPLGGADPVSCWRQFPLAVSDWEKEQEIV